MARCHNCLSFYGEFSGVERGSMGELLLNLINEQSELTPEISGKLDYPQIIFHYKIEIVKIHGILYPDFTKFMNL